MNKFNAFGDVIRPAQASGIKISQKLKAVRAVPVDPLQLSPGSRIVLLCSFPLGVTVPTIVY